MLARFKRHSRGGISTQPAGIDETLGGAVGNPVGTEGTPVGKPVGMPVGKPVGKLVGTPVGISGVTPVGTLNPVGLPVGNLTVPVGNWNVPVGKATVGKTPAV